MFSMESDYSELLRRPNWLILPSPEAQPAPRVHSSFTSRLRTVTISTLSYHQDEEGKRQRITTGWKLTILASCTCQELGSSPGAHWLHFMQCKSVVTQLFER